MNRLLRSLPWCFFNPSAIVCLSLIHGGAWRKKHCVAWAHQWLQRRLRSRRAAAVQWNDIHGYRHYGRRLHHHHSRCAGRVCRARVANPLDERRAMVCCAGRRELARWCCDPLSIGLGWIYFTLRCSSSACAERAVAPIGSRAQTVSLLRAVLRVGARECVHAT